ncbi:MAG: hypothetical protein LCH20_01670 [Proteobacteria bacterium]|nr:hypothetical protein [Pseudomonadota bacterium]
MNSWEKTSTELYDSALASIDSAVVLYRELVTFLWYLHYLYLDHHTLYRDEYEF